MEFVMTILEGAWRYVTTIRIADYLDIALMAYCCYLLLRLVRSTRAESLVKGIMVFLLALWISHVFKLNGIYFILNHMLDVGILHLPQSSSRAPLKTPSRRRCSPAPRCPRPARAC